VSRSHYAGLRITTRQLANCKWNSGLASKNFPLSLILSPADPELFSDLAGKISQLLASLASVWKNLSTPLPYGKQNGIFVSVSKTFESVTERPMFQILDWT
jgi:hypothetical protein